MKFTKEEFYFLDKMLSIVLHNQENEISLIRGKPLKEMDFDKDSKDFEIHQNNIMFIRKLHSKLKRKTKKPLKEKISDFFNRSGFDEMEGKWWK